MATWNVRASAPVSVLHIHFFSSYLRIPTSKHYVANEFPRHSLIFRLPGRNRRCFVDARISLVTTMALVVNVVDQFQYNGISTGLAVVKISFVAMITDSSCFLGKLTISPL